MISRTGLQADWLEERIMLLEMEENLEDFMSFEGTPTVCFGIASFVSTV